MPVGLNQIVNRSGCSIGASATCTRHRPGSTANMFSASASPIEKGPDEIAMSSRRCGLRLGPSHPVDALHDHLGEGFKAQGGLDVALVTCRPIVLRSTWTSSPRRNCREAHGLHDQADHRQVRGRQGPPHQGRSHRPVTKINSANLGPSWVKALEPGIDGGPGGGWTGRIMGGLGG